jgi:hypothetical protein
VFSSGSVVAKSRVRSVRIDDAQFSEVCGAFLSARDRAIILYGMQRA